MLSRGRVPDVDRTRPGRRGEQLPVAAQVEPPGVIVACAASDQAASIPGLDVPDRHATVNATHDQAAAVRREVGRAVLHPRREQLRRHVRPLAAAGLRSHPRSSPR